MVVRSLCDGLIRAALLAAITLLGCSGDDDDDGPSAGAPDRDSGEAGAQPSAGDAAAADAGDGGAIDAGAADAGDGGTLGCTLALASKVAPLVDPEVRFPLPSFAWTGNGVVGVWPRSDGAGYRVLELDPNGVTTTPLRTLWTEEPASGDPSIAVRDGVLALADKRQVGVNTRAICRLALVELANGPSLRAPARVGDVPDDETGVNEAGVCAVAETADGFLMVWQQHTRANTPDWELLAQAFSTKGEPQGTRLLLSATGEAQPIVPLVRSSGTRVLVAHHRGAGRAITLHYVENGEVETVEVELESAALRLDYGHGSFLLRTSQQLHFLDGHGQAMREPAEVGLRATFAPLGMGYVSLSQEEFVIARAYDAALRARSPAVSLSSNRAAIADGLVYAPDGQSAAAIVIDFAALLYVPFTCKR